MSQLAGMAVVLCFLLVARPVSAIGQVLEDERIIAEGLLYQRYVIEDPTRAVAHVVRVNCGRGNLKIDLVLAGDGLGAGCEPVSSLAQRAAKTHGPVLVALNGGFFGQGCNAIGALVGNGELWRESEKAWVHVGFTEDCRMLTSNTVRFDVRLELPDGSPLDVRLNKPVSAKSPSLFTLRYRGQLPERTGECVLAALSGTHPLCAREVQVATVALLDAKPACPQPTANQMVLAATGRGALLLRSALAAAAPSGSVKVRTQVSDPTWRTARCAIMGAGWVLRNGRPDARDWSLFGATFRGLQPRTVVGSSGDQLFFVVVDGRQRGHSMGMSFDMLAAFMRDGLGCSEAVNLDGGGSSTLVVGGEVVNCPSDGAEHPCRGAERAVSNALVVLHRDADAD